MSSSLVNRGKVWVGWFFEVLSVHSCVHFLKLSHYVLLYNHRSESEGVLVDLSDTTPSSSGSTSSPDTDLRLAMELSARAQEEEERRRKEEEEELERILQLSLLEKWQSKMREGKTKGVPVIAITINFFIYTFLQIHTALCCHWHTTTLSYILSLESTSEKFFLIQKISNFFFHDFYCFPFSFPPLKRWSRMYFIRNPVLLF